MTSAALVTPAATSVQAAVFPELHRTVGALCRGRTAVVGHDGERWAAGLADHVARGVQCVDLDSGPPPRRFRTVLVAGVLERVDAGRRRDVIDAALELVDPGGRLVVVVPNGDSQPREAPERLFQRDLRKLLRPYGRPTVATSQPFAWLVLHLRKRAGRPKAPDRTRQDRYRVTVELCRGRVLELGCGDGTLAATIHASGHEVVGVDMNADKIRRARETHSGVTFIERNILDLELPDEGFDTVVIAEVLEHVADAAGAEILDRAWRFVRPAGRLVVSVPNGTSIPHPNHVRQFDRRRLERLLQRFGRPHLSTAQPFKWLLAHVDRAHP